MSDIPNPFQLSLTKVADMFTTVAIKSQPAYIPNDKGIIKCPLDFIDNNFSNINDCFFNSVYDTEYTVTISDEVSYNEFTKKYEVLEYNEENNTYVIREKENVD